MHHPCIHQCTNNAFINASCIVQCTINAFIIAFINASSECTINASSMHTLHQMHQFRSFSSSFIISASSVHLSMHHQCIINALSVHLSIHHQCIHQCIRDIQCQFSENICSEDDLRSRSFETFVAKCLACLPLLGFLKI